MRRWKRPRQQNARSERRQREAPVQLRIESIAAGGEGVGRLPDGTVIFVHRTAPGEQVEVEVVERRKRWARGRLQRVMEASTDRRTAPCAFYADCGGCTLEHLQYPAQLRAKARIVADAFHRIGGIRIGDPEVVLSPREHRYRNRVSFALRRLAEERVVAGFHALGRPELIVDMDGSCLLPEEPIARAWDALRAGWGPGARRLPSGEVLRLTLRSNAAGEVSLLVEGGSSPGRPDELLDVVPELVSIWHRAESAAAERIAGSPGLPETWGDETIELEGAAFLQVNRGAAAGLEAHVLERAGAVRGARVVDAYCGIGLHARRLARAGAEVVGIELERDAVAEAERMVVPGARFLQGRVEDLLPAQLPAELVILNPPRAGLAPAVAEALLAGRPRRIIYVSCDPATLARDLKRLADAFELQGVRCFDLFPQTAHVESVAELSLRTR